MAGNSALLEREGASGLWQVLTSRVPAPASALPLLLPCAGPCLASSFHVAGIPVPALMVLKNVDEEVVMTAQSQRPPKI